MSGAAVVNYLLSNDSAVTALVPAARIVTGAVELNTTLPAICVRQIDDVERLDAKMTGSRFVTERVQITAYARSYANKKAILKAARDACVGHGGSINGISVDSILPDGAGPDLDDPGDEIFEQSRDLIVRWHMAS